MLKTTVGQLLLNDALPPEHRDYARTWDKKTTQAVLQRVADEHPDKYKDVSKRLSDLGHQVAYHSGGFSFGLDDMATPPEAHAFRERLRGEIKQIQQSKLPDAEKDRRVVEHLGSQSKPFEDVIYKAMREKENPLAMQVASGARGNPGNLRSIVGGDLMYEGHNGKAIPIPILSGYAKGLSPVEYWASTYGTRKGVVDLKMATQNAGYFGKQLNQATHRLVVTDHDAPEGDPHHHRGMPVDTNDAHNEGALLAREAGRYKRDTVLTPRILAELGTAGHDKILVRSPIAGGPPGGGLYAKDVGIRERGGFSPRGDFVGMAAAQSLGEPVTQSSISSKHAGGVAGAGGAVSGFKYINQLVQVPKVFTEGAAHAQKDGKVSAMWKAPAGGHYIMIGGVRHYVEHGHEPHVKVGDTVEAGDVLSEGLPNPAEIVAHKGIGEGRRHFVHAMRKMYADSGLPYHRRNGELLARGLINHVRLTDDMGDFINGDVVPYDTLEHTYSPRPGHEITEAKRAVGKYLERPALHHTIGTKVRPSMLPDFERFGVHSLVVHDEPPPFEPEMIRGMEQMSRDPDWMTQHLGSNLQKSLLTSAHRGAVSDEAGTSFVPGLSRAADFGRVGLTKGWDPLSVKKPGV